MGIFYNTQLVGSQPENIWRFGDCILFVEFQPTLFGRILGFKKHRRYYACRGFGSTAWYRVSLKTKKVLYKIERYDDSTRLARDRWAIDKVRDYFDKIDQERSNLQLEEYRNRKLTSMMQHLDKEEN